MCVLIRLFFSMPNSIKTFNLLNMISFDSSSQHANNDGFQLQSGSSSTVREKVRMLESVGLIGQQRGESVTSPTASSEQSTHSNVTSPATNRRVSRYLLYFFLRGNVFARKICRPTSLVSANTSDSSPDDERDSQPRLSIDTFSGMDSINSRLVF